MIKLKTTFLILPLVLLLPSCVSMIAGNMADGLSTAMLNQDDPETVRSGAPAYLLMLDGLIEGNPDNADMLLAGSKLYNSYASIFVEDSERSIRLSNKAFVYALRSICERNQAICQSYNHSFDTFSASLKSISEDDIAYLYGFGSAWAGVIQANSGDWNAIADLPKITVVMQQIVKLDETYDNGGAHAYLGVLSSLRPPSLGGKPEVGREHFEKAIELSSQKNLMYKVLFARHYARLVYNRDLHDKLLNEVLKDEAKAPGLTLINTLAKQDAKVLLDSAEEYF